MHPLSFRVASIISVNFGFPIHPAMGNCKSWLRRHANSYLMVTPTSLGTFGILNTLVELEERRRGFAKLNAAYKALTDEFRAEEGPSHFDIWGKSMKESLLRMEALAAEVATAESLAERFAVETREKEVSHRHHNVQSTGAIFSLELPHVLIDEERRPATTECSISSPRQS